jgi:transposase
MGGIGVIGVDQYQDIRHLAAVEGLSQREIARILGISRNTVKRYFLGQNLPGERAKRESRPQVITPAVIEFVNRCLEQDKMANRKQRHTSKRIYDRLRHEQGFEGAESSMRRLVSQLRGKMPEVFIPLAFSPGEAAQVDWGTATVIIAGQKTEAHLFCFRLCNSCAPFVTAFPVEREEAFLEAHQRAFEYFGGVSRTLIYDNLKTAVKEGWGKLAKQQDQFISFRAHYAYQARFCNPGEGHEKGLVEGLVGYIRRNVLVPIPAVGSWNQLNEALLERCQGYLAEHQIRGHELSVRDAFAIEKTALTRLPVKPYDTALTQESRVDYFSTVSFDKNRYSVPVNWASHTVTVKGRAFEIEIYHRGRLLARHQRSYGSHQTIYQMEHYLCLLEKRPGAVMNARPVRDANLPQDIWNFARALKDPDKGMVRLLRLVVDHGLNRVLTAVRRAHEHQQLSVEIVAYYTTADAAADRLPLVGPAVQPVDLGCYDRLLAGGGAS